MRLGLNGMSVVRWKTEGPVPVLTARSLGGTERVNVCYYLYSSWGPTLSFPLSASVPYSYTRLLYSDGGEFPLISTFL